MPEFTQRSGQGPGHPRPAGPAVWRALHQAGRGHQSLHLQGKTAHVKDGSSDVDKLQRCD